MFDPTSRYYDLAVQTENLSNGQYIAFTGRRFLPPLEKNTVVATVNLTASDRLDTLAASFLGDPLLFWCICDANNTMNPLTALQPGQSLLIAPPSRG